VRVTLVRLDVRRPDHLAPLLGFVCDQFSEIGRRAPEDDAAQIGQLDLQLRIGEARIDLRVELVDDRGGRIPGCAEAEKPLDSASTPGQARQSDHQHCQVTTVRLAPPFSNGI
jgi:hypothetical protein